jgi:hypothetical protein
MTLALDSFAECEGHIPCDQLLRDGDVAAGRSFHERGASDVVPGTRVRMKAEPKRGRQLAEIDQDTTGFLFCLLGAVRRRPVVTVRSVLQQEALD